MTAVTKNRTYGKIAGFGLRADVANYEQLKADIMSKA
jgi:hypothetical protein